MDSRVIEIAQSEDGQIGFREEDLRLLKNMFASAHVNYLIGAGFSVGQTPALGFREKWFTAVDEKIQSGVDDYSEYRTLRNMLLLEFFYSVVSHAGKASVAAGQSSFVKNIIDILENRGAITLPKRANVFTTNYDPYLELALESSNLAYNDGFEGRNEPKYSTRSFAKMQVSQSLSMEYTVQEPMVNVVKIHGSITWKSLSNSAIGYSNYPETIQAFLADNETAIRILEQSGLAELIETDPNTEALKQAIEHISSLEPDDRGCVDKAAEQYLSIFPIVNPTKNKFRETVLGLTYYELLRLYANELDRNNALLVVFGFSFEDEHLLEITKRALANPNLIVLISCYREDDYERYVEKFGQRGNIWYLKSENPLNLDVFNSAMNQVCSK